MKSLRLVTIALLLSCSAVGFAAPSITTLSPTSGTIGTLVTISGSGFGSTQGTSTVKFNGTTATSITSWSATQIKATVPTGATTGNVVVTVSNVASNGKTFTIVSVTSLTPATGAVGSSVVISGSGFGSPQGSSTVKFNGVTATTISSWGATSITAVVPGTATTGNVVVTVGGVASNGVTFTVTPAPIISSLTPNTGAVGSSIVIAGSNFGPSQGNGKVAFTGTATPATITNWSATSITAVVPTGASTGNVVVTAAGGVASNGVSFTVTPAPSIGSLSPSTGAVGSSIVIAGSNFGPSQGNGFVTFGSTQATTITSWSVTSITAVVPTGASTGNVVVTAAGGVASAGGSFTVTPAPSITSLTPNTGTIGSSVTIAGANFNAQGTGSKVTFNGTQATSITNWTSTSITAVVPTGATTGNVVVTAAGGVSSTGANFTVATAPSITSLTPTSGEPGASVTITGTNFTTITGTVTFNGQVASTSSWSNASIVAVVPNGASSGNVVATASGLQSNSVAFTVLVPSITSLNPTSGSPGVSVTITGTNFGTSAGTVTFAGQSASITSWSDSSIVAVVPSTASTGAVVVNNGGLQSNSITFTVVGQVFSGAITYSYDELGRLVGAVAASGDSVKYEYDAVGNILSITRYEPNQVAVFTFNPKSGPVGTQVTISGANFSANAAQDTVSFNGTAASITSASTTTLVANVPAGATTGTITITSPIGSVASADSFTVTSSSGVPSITSFTPQIVASGASVTISGTNFDSSSQNDRLTVNVTPTTLPTSVTSSSLIMTVPGAAGSGHISLGTPGGNTNSSADLFIPPSGFTPAQVAYTGRTNFGTATPVSIGTANKIGQLLFEGKAGHNASINLSAPTFSSCSFQIYKPDNTALGSSSSCSSASFLASQSLPMTGTYAVVINASAGSAGSGVFTIYDSSDIVGTLTPGGPPFTITTTVPGQNAHLTFFGNTNQHVSISFSNSSFTHPNCSLSIYNPDGTSLLSGVDCSNSINATDVPSLPERGTYSIWVYPSSTHTGTVTLTLNNVTDINGGALTLGNSVSPALTVPGQNANYTFSGTQNQHISISILSSTISSCLFEIYNPDGTTLVNGPAFCSQGTTFYDIPVLPQTGTYKFVVDPQGAATGTVTFKLNDATDVTGAITADGTPVTFATTVPGQKAKFTFSGTAGQNVTVLLDNNTYSNLALNLVAPDGSIPVGSGGVGPVFLDDATYCPYLCGTRTLPTTGTYTVVVAPVSGATGQARVRVFTISSDLTTSGTLGGPQVPITIGTPGQNAKITFTGTQGGRIGIGFSGAAFSGVANPGFTFVLLNPDGSQFGGFFNGGPFSFSTSTTSGLVEFNDVFTFPTTGTYTVVLDPTGDTTGNISLMLNNATDLNLNISADGTVNNVSTTSPSQNAHLNFTSSIGQTVSALVTNITYPSQPSFTLRRVDAGGNVTNQEFASTDGSNIFLPPFTITQSGSYFLFLDPANQDVGTASVQLYTVNDISTTIDTVNDPVTVTTTVPGQNANLTFSATAGQTLTWAVSNPSFSANQCLANLKAPDGSVLFQRDCTIGAPWSNTRTASQTGTYTIIVDPVRSATGSLTVSVTAQ